MKIIFAAGSKIALLKEDKLEYLESNYLKTYRKNIKEIADRRSWKTEGMGAQFRGDINPYKYAENENEGFASINGISLIEEGKKIVYSISFHGYSGIFIKSLIDEEELETHIIHGSKAKFYSMDLKSGTNEMVVAIEDSGIEKNLAVMDMNNGHYHFITEGDSIDENPVWGRASDNCIYFDTRGIGRDDSGQIVGYSTKEICKLNLETSEIEEVVAMKDFDCSLPKEDEEGNIYFIKKPYNMPVDKSASFKDFVLIPVKLLKAVFNFLEFFTMRYTGEAFKTRGANPAKGKNDPKEMFIHDNLVNVEKSLKENQSSGERYPGIAPRSWELVKMDNKGDITTIKKGVIDFDLTSEGEIVYSNGKHIIKRSSDGTEKLLKEVELASRIRAI